MIETAVSPGTLTPGLYLVVNLLAGAASPSTGVLRILILAPKTASGDLTMDTEIRTGGGVDSAAVAFGTGGPGHLAAKQLYAMFPNAVIDFGAPAAGAGTPTRNFVFTGTPAGNNAIRFDVCGREFDVGWLAGEAADTMKAKAIAAILQRTTDLPVTAVDGGAGIATVNGKLTGDICNDVKIKATLLYPQTGTEAVTPTTATALTGGTTAPDFTDILAAASGEEYHGILMCISNADAESAASSSNAERALVHIESLNTGLDAKLQTLCYGSTGTLANAKTGAIGRNVGYAQHVFCLSGRSLPCEHAAAELGDRLYSAGLDPAANRIGNRIGSGLYGAADQIADKPTTPELEDAIGNGVSIFSYDSGGNLYTVRPITTYSQGPGSAPDRRLLDVQNVDAIYIVARDLRSALPAEFPNAKITKDTQPGEDLPPKGVIEERDVKAFCISRMRVWERQGVVLKSALDEVIENGEFIVQVNDSDPTQVDILIPAKIVPPLAKFGLMINRVPN